MTDDEMQEKYGKNWDTKPHGSDQIYGDCECDFCDEWRMDYKKWEATLPHLPGCVCEDCCYETKLSKADAAIDAARDKE